jgi:hypothetical protein
VRAVLALAALCAVLTAPASAARPGYDAAVEALRADGRAVAALVAAGDADAILARFTPRLPREVPRADVEQVLSQRLAQAPLGEVVGESALPLAPDRRAYIADHRWGAGTLTLTVVLDAAGAIDAIGLRPPAPIGRDPRAATG